MFLRCLYNMDKELLQRYVEGNVSREETEKVVDWLDQDESNVREFMALHKLYDISVLNKPAGEDKSLSSESKQRSGHRRIVYELLKIAAVFLLFLVISRFLPEKQSPVPDDLTYQTLFIPAGQRAELILPDSTKVWLNAKTKLVYPVHFGKGERTITLDGEAFFDVKRNEKQPFVVKTNNMDIKVLGTEFNVMAYSTLGNTEVALLNGSVDIIPAETTGKSKYHKMNVNEHATLHNGKLEISEINDFDYFKWKEGLLCFNNETVNAIIGKLQLYFDIKIDVQRQELLNYRYTGKFRTKDGVEQVLKVLQLEHKFTYTRDNELNVITIK